MGDDGTDLGWSGDVDAHLELATLALVGAYLASRPTSAMQIPHHVLRRQPALLGVGQDGPERAHHLAHHRRRAVLRQLVFERARHGHCQLRQLNLADQRCDVVLEVAPILIERGALQFSIGCPGEPELAGLGDRGAAAVGGVDSNSDFVGGFQVVGFGVLLAREGLDVPVAVLIDIIRDPGFLAFSAWARPSSPSD